MWGYNEAHNKAHYYVLLIELFILYYY